MIPLTHCQGKTVAVFGLGKAGRSMVEALRAGGAEVIAWDDNEAGRQDIQARLLPPDQWPWPNLSMLVLSPGIHRWKHPVAVMADAKECPILGEVELLYRQRPHASFLGITGTNGKSTTTELLGHLLRAGGKTPEVGGNLGVAAVALAESDLYVLEMSSYQLDLCQEVHFRAACLLNVSIDHLERHGTMEGYIAAKRRIFSHMGNEDLAVIGWDEPYTAAVLAEMQKTFPGILVGVGAVSRQPAQVRDHIAYEGTRLFLTLPSLGIAQAVLDLADAPSLQGPHNAQNAATAIAMALHQGSGISVIQPALNQYHGLPHRMEQVAQTANIRFINDSKATNADAAEQALKSFDQIYWIAGGKAKEGDVLNTALIREKVVKAYLIGDAQIAFAEALNGVVPVEKCGTLAKAFAAATAQIQAADSPKQAVLLLSPACASFDQWKNFEERGTAFRDLSQAWVSHHADA